jgi:branched-chain amino acid transport system substrate-binding protein
VASLPKILLILCAVGMLLVVMAAACGGGTAGEQPQAQEAVGPLRMGLLLNFSGGSPERSGDRRRAFDLAVKHVNEGGGVFGQPVEAVVGDSTLDPEAAVIEAKRLVEVENIHVLVGPSTSANTLRVAEGVTGPASIPTISPSSTSPLLTEAVDDDFLFRTALSDSAQGPVLARVTREQGFTNVGLIYRKDAWGQGLADSFQEAWAGEIRAVAIEPDETTYLLQLERTAVAGAQALVLITFEAEAVTILREALENKLYAQFTFGDALKSPGLVQALGPVGLGRRLGGMYGTAAGIAPGPPERAGASTAWEKAYVAEYGALPKFAYVKETYDATIALALAAQAAGSVDGAAIRDQLRSIGSGPGTPVIAGPEGVAEALRILDEEGTVDYDGAAVTLDWDEQGDLTRGHIGIWRFIGDGTIEEVETVHVEY